MRFCKGSEPTIGRYKAQNNVGGLIPNIGSETLACMNWIAVQVDDGHLVIIQIGICFNNTLSPGHKYVLDPLSQLE
jgi:hypothetical protein